MVWTWHYVALTFAISLVSSYINQNSSELSFAKLLLESESESW